MSRVLLGEVWIFLEIAIVGAIAFLAAFWLQKLRQVSPSFVSPRRDTILRLIIGKKVTRVRFESESGHAWSLQNPIAKDDPVEITVGMPIYGSFGSPSGVVKFRSSVTEVLDDGRFSVAAPNQTLVQERRKERRIWMTTSVHVEGVNSKSLDLSPIGGRFRTAYKAKKGERIRLDLPGIHEPVFGWVLEPSRGGLRVRFEDRIDLRDIEGTTVPFLTLDEKTDP